ncbi:hypothetical protein HUT19_40940 [Streptomyces sp. NA02950]|uniref:DUF6415 family natural product biosynthesis protein n=1 Tax=Streptomyces sp. NA02950 TaxID=2742137 RepID=UPI00159208EF|nr:DUF6415 family natural product biosynthesis protein [Streptomyces sp. NA02950]QKV90414.1 hypothetical protein HUT19_00280 [Streptomyces sp. NA02950]QKV97253.1 hypothetical protein HUT19_40940 [Streptomyces sp. NA02950]
MITALHKSFVSDEGIDDDLDTAIGLQSALLTMEDVQGLAPRIHRHLHQLLNMLVQRAARVQSPDLTVFANRARQLDLHTLPANFASARGYVRRLALLTEDVLEVLRAEAADTAGSTSVEEWWSV